MGMMLFVVATLAGVGLVFTTGSPQPGQAGYESRDVSLGIITLVSLGSIAAMLLATWLALAGGAL